MASEKKKIFSSSGGFPEVAALAVAVCVGAAILFALRGTPPKFTDRGHEPVASKKSLPAESANSQFPSPAPHIVKRSALSVPETTTLSLSAEREKTLERIHEATVTYSEEGLAALSPLLMSKDPEIRAAAVEGIVQLGVAGGAAVLRDAASRSTIAEDRKTMLDSAAFIELPPYPVR